VLTGASDGSHLHVRCTRFVADWTIMIEFGMGVYKYISYSSILALLPICSAEKHIRCARECKSLLG
jgi:hypothetical protein